MSFKISWKVHVICFIMALAICMLMQEFINNLFLGMLINNIIWPVTGSITINQIIFLLVIMVPVTLVHEWIHGSTYKIFGGKVRYGFKGIYAYAQETSGMPLHRTKFLIVLLAPVTVITLISLLLPGWTGPLVFILNLIGSTGDLLMGFFLCKTNENSYILDKKYGFDVI